MPTHSQMNLPPVLLANDTQDEAPRPKCTPAVASVHAAELFDEALTDARITTAEVAYLLSVSESLVRRMRSKDARERVSFAQMLLLPPAFHWALHKSMSTRYGYGRKALTDLLEAAGRIAMVIG